MEVILHKNFIKKFKRLPDKIQNKFEEKLKILLENPFSTLLNNHRVGVVFPNCRSINITGDYRAIFQEENKTIIFITIGTHSDLYR